MDKVNDTVVNWDVNTWHVNKNHVNEMQSNASLNVVLLNPLSMPWGPFHGSLKFQTTPNVKLL